MRWCASTRWPRRAQRRSSRWSPAATLRLSPCPAISRAPRNSGRRPQGASLSVRFASLGSGSRGNATLVQAGDTVLMVDCGFSMTETERRLTRLGLAPDSLAAILVTHEHSDHVSGVARFAARHGITVWSTAGTRIASEKQGLRAAEAIHGEKP